MNKHLKLSIICLIIAFIIFIIGFTSTLYFSSLDFSKRILPGVVAGIGKKLIFIYFIFLLHILMDFLICFGVYNYKKYKKNSTELFTVFTLILFLVIFFIPFLLLYDWIWQL